MEAFLKSVERRAFRMIQIATGNSEDALDILQDAMLVFVRAYADKPREQLKVLFYRIIQNKIRDWYRRRKIRNVFVNFFTVYRKGKDNEDGDPMQLIEDIGAPDPYEEAKTGQAMRRLESALRGLPPRQRQVFLLRAWEELSVEETATAMGCSPGTVKTHYSRAVSGLRQKLEDVWP
jgi:RNA polymerase sigma-70 factor (ECF subfamily)